MADDTLYMVCLRVSELSKNLTVDGAEKDTCFQCHEEVWLSPASRQTKIENNGKTICMPCALSNGAEDFLLGPDQLKEAKEQLRREAERN